MKRKVDRSRVMAKSVMVKRPKPRPVAKRLTPTPTATAQVPAPHGVVHVAAPQGTIPVVAHDPVRGVTSVAHVEPHKVTLKPWYKRLFD